MGFGKTKQFLKARLKKARRSYSNAFHSFSPADIGSGLSALGIGSGDTLLVHSSYDAFEGYLGKPTEVNAALQSTVGPTGAVMMPTLPFSGTAVEYSRSNPIFDVLRTPSRMGLLSELFRRSPDVVRSVHPTHPVAIWGRDSAALAEGHHLAKTPCGLGSPYMQLLERRGKILLAGTDVDVLTFYHSVEELLEGKLPFSPFTTEVFLLRSRNRSAEIVETHTRLFDPAISRRRNLSRLGSELRLRGAWREQRRGRLRMVALDAGEVLLAVEALLNRGIFCYD